MGRWTTFALGLAIIAGPFGSAIAEEVGYRVTFDATWSDATHGPEAFVGSAHFSPLVGNTHNSSVTFWEVGSLASVGIEMMAELGASAPLNAETQTAINAGTAYSFIAGSGISSPDSVETSFIISSTHPLVTLVTMVAPSPDWFLGVSELELYSANVWLDDVVVDLFVYDAGTDNGVDFDSPDSDTDPADPIALLGAPFTGKPELGTFTFELLGHCEDGVDNDGDGLVDEGRVVWIQNRGVLGERRAVLCNWVSETLLGERLPRPPANVPQLPDAVPDGLTARELIDARRLDPAVVEAHVPTSQIIGEDHDDVWPRLGLAGQRGRRAQQAGEDEEATQIRCLHGSDG